MQTGSYATAHKSLPESIKNWWFWCKPRMLSKYTQKYESNYEHSIFTKYKNTEIQVQKKYTYYC